MHIQHVKRSPSLTGSTFILPGTSLDCKLLGSGHDEKSSCWVLAIQIKYCSPGKAFEDSLFAVSTIGLGPAPILVELIGGISWGCGLETFGIILSNGRSSSSES